MLSFRKHLFLALENRSHNKWGKRFGMFLFFLIILNVVLVSLETVEMFSPYHQLFFWAEAVSVGFFTIEYLLRIWTAPMKSGYEERSWRYIFSPLMLFDLIVILPFYLTVFGSTVVDVRFLRVFRLIRIFRIFRLSRYSAAMDRVLSVLKKEKDELLAVFGLMTMLLLISSSFVYFVEHTVDPSAYPSGKNEFTSIPATFWWGMATITTIGYGDMVPVTDIGKALGFITGILGIAVVALPTGLLGASFYREITDRREHKMQAMKKQLEEIMSMTEEHGNEIDNLVRKHFDREKKLRDEVDRLKKEKGEAIEAVKSEDHHQQIKASKEKLLKKVQMTWQHFWH